MYPYIYTHIYASPVVQCINSTILPRSTHGHIAIPDESTRKKSQVGVARAQEQSWRYLRGPKTAIHCALWEKNRFGTCLRKMDNSDIRHQTKLQSNKLWMYFRDCVDNPMRGNGHIGMSKWRWRCRRSLYVSSNTCVLYTCVNGTMRRVWWIAFSPCTYSTVWEGGEDMYLWAQGVCQSRHSCRQRRRPARRGSKLFETG